MYLIAVLVSILGLVVYLDLPTYVYALNSGLLAKYFYYASIAAIAPILLLKLKEFLLYLASPFALWVIAEIFIHSFDLFDANEQLTQFIKEREQYLSLALLYGFTASLARTKSYESIFPVLGVIIPTLVLIDFVNPGTFYPLTMEGVSPGRAAALYLNANRASEVILLICLLSVGTVRFQYRMPLLLLAGASVIVTFSRSAIIAWALFSFFLLATRKLPKYSFFISVSIFASLPLLIGVLKSYILERQDLEHGVENILERLDFFQTQSLNDSSAQIRKEVLKAGWQVFLDHPILGAGTGITEFRSEVWHHLVNTENQLVMVAAEHGVIGIAMWVGLLAILWKGRYFHDPIFQKVAAMGILFMAFFDNHMFTNLYWPTTFALVSGSRRA